MAVLTAKKPAVLQLDSTWTSSSTQAATKSALESLGVPYELRTDFWGSIGSDKVTELPENMVVLASLSRVAAAFDETNPPEWVAGVRIAKPYLIGLLSSPQDRSAASKIEPIFRASEQRFTTCELHRPFVDSLTECLARAAAVIRPNGVVAVNYSNEDESLWLMFGDGRRGQVRWSDLGLQDREPVLRPETTHVADGDPETVEVLDVHGGLFEIDGASLRSLVDKGAEEQLQGFAMNDAAALGTTLANARLSRRLTQDEVAARSGLAQEQISRLESGKHWPRIDTLRSYARGLGISVGELLLGANQETPMIVAAKKDKKG